MIINLPSRYHDVKTTFNTETGIITTSDYFRVGHNEDNSIAFIDPAGGPFLHIGSKLNGKFISKIEFLPGEGYKISFINEQLS